MPSLQVQVYQQICQSLKDHPDVALIPIVSSVRALKIIIKRWKDNRIPDAVIVEGL